MTLATVQVSEMMAQLEKEDYDMAVSYIQFLLEKRKKERAQKAKEIIDQVQTIIGEDKGWDSEEEMLVDMARFRKERLGL